MAGLWDPRRSAQGVRLRAAAFAALLFAGAFAVLALDRCSGDSVAHETISYGSFVRQSRDLARDSLWLSTWYCGDVSGMAVIRHQMLGAGPRGTTGESFGEPFAIRDVPEDFLADVTRRPYTSSRREWVDISGVVQRIAVEAESAERDR